MQLGAFQPFIYFIKKIPYLGYGGTCVLLKLESMDCVYELSVATWVRISPLMICCMKGSDSIEQTSEAMKLHAMPMNQN